MPSRSLVPQGQEPGDDRRRVVTLPDVVLRRITAADGELPDPDDSVSAATAALRRHGIPDNTEAIYRRQWWRWVRWCGETGREHLPATKGTIEEWINAHWTMTTEDGKPRGRYGRPYAPATVELSLAVISVVHQWAGFPSPTRHPDVHRTFRGYRRRWSEHGYRPDQAYALSPEDVLAMVRTCDLSTAAGLRNAAIIRLSFDMGARRSEMCYLDIGDLRFDTPERLIVRVPRSKTDQDAHGRDVPIEADTDLAPQLCPLLLLREWLDLLALRGHTQGPLFRLVRSGQRRKDGTHSGLIRPDRMTGRAIETVVVDAAKRAGVDRDPVTGNSRHVVPHSLRAGFATSAAEANVDTAFIAAHGGWAPESPVVFRYVRSGRKWGEHNPASRIRKAHRAGGEQ